MKKYFNIYIGGSKNVYILFMFDHAHLIYVYSVFFYQISAVVYTEIIFIICVTEH